MVTPQPPTWIQQTHTGLSHHLTKPTHDDHDSKMINIHPPRVPNSPYLTTWKHLHHDPTGELTITNPKGKIYRNELPQLGSTRTPAQQGRTQAFLTGIQQGLYPAIEAIKGTWALGNSPLASMDPVAMTLLPHAHYALTGLSPRDTHIILTGALVELVPRADMEVWLKLVLGDRIDLRHLREYPAECGGVTRLVWSYTHRFPTPFPAIPTLIRGDAEYPPLHIYTPSHKQITGRVTFKPQRATTFPLPIQCVVPTISTTYLAAITPPHR